MDANAQRRIWQQDAAAASDPARQAAVWRQPAPAAPQARQAAPAPAPAAPPVPLTRFQEIEAQMKRISAMGPLPEAGSAAWNAEISRREAMLAVADNAPPSPSLPPMPSEQALRSMTLEQHRAAVDAARGVHTTRIMGGATVVVVSKL